MKMTAGVIKGYGEIDVPYTLLSKGKKVEGIAILLPGLGYTVQAPLLHYSTGIYLEKNFDVLHVNYQYSSANYETFSVEEVDDALKHDVNIIIDKVLQHHAYPHIHIVAKSFGTLALGNEAGRESVQDAKFIWLTPLLKEDEIFQAMLNSKQEGLCIVGDEDRHHDEGRFIELKKNPRLEMHLIKGVNHSLEHDFKVLDSISTHKEIMSIIKAFSEA
ncbi:alpha/beta hydrolase [Rossellomorea sp. SC111]|uniref:alpha/beta hydrolase n=1 Tax=Rossellomorea sp. SC111 TaxID=2968985 RepID=UPI00215A3D2F|nr:alpha/beta hydrolase [Rossellomorea sp. SC111]MCR8847822.1 alpha/beta hydrolase [Rossellomorea sp. SC111]